MAKLLKKEISQLNSRERSQIFELIEPYYATPLTLLRKELELNNKIYIFKDDTQGIVAFFMTGWKQVFLLNEEYTAIYLGLSCVKNNQIQKKLGSKLYYYFTEEALHLKKKNTILFGTTATPVILLTLPKIWKNVQPTLNGDFTDREKVLVRELKKLYGMDSYSTKHPFVLKRYSHTRYSLPEKLRLEDMTVQKGITTFQKLNIKETEGDRLIITCRLPSKSDFVKLHNKIFNEHRV